MYRCPSEWKPVCDTRGHTHTNLCDAEREGHQTMQRELVRTIAFAKLPAKLAEEEALPAYRRGSSSMAEVPAGSSASPPEPKKLPKRRS